MLSLPISTPLPDAPPRELTTEKPVRLVLVGGFLGAGKTTALNALARTLTERGLRVGIVTNDQAAHLVDTETTRQAGFVTSEVAGGCFCCRFSNLIDAAQEVIAVAQPDVLLCEPVGSCTDMAATVIAPLRHFYPKQLTLAPFSVLVDAERVLELILDTRPGMLASEAAYIFAKQLEEADEIVLSKVDTLSPDTARQVGDALAARFHKPVRQMSATRGDGLAAWVNALVNDTGTTGAGAYPLREIDYDTYAVGEAVLGWLNLTASLSAVSPFSPRSFAAQVLDRIQAACAAPSASGTVTEIAHVKLSLTDDGAHFLRANLTATQGKPAFTPADWPQATHATLVLNARVQSSPERLEKIVRTALEEASATVGTMLVLETLSCFSPSYPRPPYRIGASPKV